MFPCKLYLINFITYNMSNYSNIIEFTKCRECTSELLCQTCKNLIEHNFACLTSTFSPKRNLSIKLDQSEQLDQLDINQETKTYCEICTQYKCNTPDCSNILTKRENNYVDYCENCLLTKCVTCCYSNRDPANELKLCSDCFVNKCSTPGCLYNKFFSNDNTNGLCYMCIKKEI